MSRYASELDDRGTPAAVDRALNAWFLRTRDCKACVRRYGLRTLCTECRASMPSAQMANSVKRAAARGDIR